MTLKLLLYEGSKSNGQYILDPCQEESYLNDHGGNMEDCRAAWEMTLHQFELSNQADRKNRVAAVCAVLRGCGLKV